MKLVGIIGTVLLSLILAAPVYAQEQHDQEEQKDQKEQTAKPAQDEKKAETEKSAKQDEKGAQQEKNTKPEEKNAQQENNNKQDPKQRKKRMRSSNSTAGEECRWQRGWPHSRRSLQGQLWTRTHVSSHPRRLQQSPLPIRWLLVRIRRPMAGQLALHATGFCGRHRRRVLPLQPDVSRRQC